jgi:hypothetical protein
METAEHRSLRRSAGAKVSCSSLASFARFGPFAALALAPLVTTCSSPQASSDPPCVAGLSTACNATYDPPSYDTIYAKIFHPTCATGNGTCHTSSARAGDLAFDNADDAYASLLGTGSNGAKKLVLAGDPACSLLMKRLASTDPNYHMPPGPEGLTAGELCTVVKWIGAGASR